ncbi:MAG: SpoVA/SpoVAEb family sporulation membrane protein, partial [Clostridia bacterium]|nr:SpoVA/SpoVAEb family sporulation membrane protein [Clostridia bacterium]
LYKPLVDFAGCGATTPLTGFGYSLAEGVRMAVDEKGLIGALTGGFTGASGGIAAAITFGYLFALLFRSHPKK